MYALVYDKELLKCVYTGSPGHFSSLPSLERRDFILTKNSIKWGKKNIGLEVNLSLSLFDYSVFFHSWRREMRM